MTGLIEQMEETGEKTTTPDSTSSKTDIGWIRWFAGKALGAVKWATGKVAGFVLRFVRFVFESPIAALGMVEVVRVFMESLCRDVALLAENVVYGKEDEKDTRHWLHASVADRLDKIRNSEFVVAVTSQGLLTMASKALGNVNFTTAATATMTAIVGFASIPITGTVAVAIGGTGVILGAVTRAFTTAALEGVKASLYMQNVNKALENAKNLLLFMVNGCFNAALVKNNVAYEYQEAHNGLIEAHRRLLLAVEKKQDLVHVAHLIEIEMAAIKRKDAAAIAFDEQKAELAKSDAAAARGLPTHPDAVAAVEKHQTNVERNAAKEWGKGQSPASLEALLNGYANVSQEMWDAPLVINYAPRPDTSPVRYTDTTPNPNPGFFDTTAKPSVTDGGANTGANAGAGAGAGAGYFGWGRFGLG
jgi:hypothetical protein